MEEPQTGTDSLSFVEKLDMYCKKALKKVFVEMKANLVKALIFVTKTAKVFNQFTD